MASVFGSDRVPRIHDGGAEVALNDVIVTRDEAIPDIVQHISPINGHRTTIVRGYWWVFEVRMHFWKNGNATLMQTYLQEIGETDHRIKRFGVADDFIKDADNNDLYFTLVHVKPSFLTNSRDKDILVARWESNDYAGLDHNL